MEPNNHEQLEQKIMREIENGQIRLRSKYIFLAEKLGLTSALVLSILVAILFISLVLYYLQGTDNLYYLGFGRRGILAFLESFPYPLVISLIICLFITGAIIKKAGLLYKKPFTYMSLGLVAVVVVAGIFLAKTTIAKRIEGECFANTAHAPIVRFFMHHNLGERNSGLAGRVVEVHEEMFRLQTPRDIRTVIFPLRSSRYVQPGMFVVAVGEWRGDVFVAYQIQVVQKDAIPSLQRSINKQFGNVPVRAN